MTSKLSECEISLDGKLKCCSGNDVGLDMVPLEKCPLNDHEKGKTFSSDISSDTYSDACSSNIKDTDMLYSVEDTPPWYICLFFGLQHYLTMVGGALAVPYIASVYLCIPEGSPARAAVISTAFFNSGIITLLQSTLGVRLPIVQGGSFAYLAPTVTLLTTRYEPCDSPLLANLTSAQTDEVWMQRMQEVQGCIAVAALLQLLLGFTGAISLILPWITPLAIVPTVTLIGLSLFDVAAQQASRHWGISIMTITFMIVFSQYLRNVRLPVPVFRRGSCTIVRFRLFKGFPIILAIFTSWCACAVLTACEVLPVGSPARTDKTLLLLNQSPWFRIPYPGQWGLPRVTTAGVVGMLAGALASTVESIGDYYACAKISGAPPPPPHAINRGIGVEGIGCILAGLLGTGGGVTSASENIGVIGLTKVGSRRVVQFAAVTIIFCGLFGKLGALFMGIPDPVLAGVFTVMFSMITSIGLSPLQYVDLGSSRNLFVMGFSLFTGLAVPKWLEENPQVIKTGSVEVDQVLTVLLQTSMFVGGFMGCLLDNTVPGTPEERGLLKWNASLYTNEISDFRNPRCYDFPFGMNTIRRQKWLRYIPFCPTFRGFKKEADTVGSPDTAQDTESDGSMTVSSCIQVSGSFEETQFK